MATTTKISKTAEQIMASIGHKAFYMMGVHGSNKPMYDSSKPNQLSFKPKGSRSVNYIKITVVNDLYNIEFGKIRGYNYKIVNTLEGYYIDMLHKAIEQNTGLYLSL